MGYYLVDSNGYLGDFGSIGGLKTFREWAEKQSDPIRAFIEEGVSDDPQSLATALDDASTTGDNESMRATLADAARKAEDVLILTDGANNALEADDEGPDDGEFETWPTPESEIDPEALAAAEAADRADGIDDETTGFSDEGATPHPSARQPRHVDGKWTKGNAEAAAATTVDHHAAAAEHHRKVAEATTGDESAAHAEAAKRHHEAAATVRAGGSGVEAVSASRRAAWESSLADAARK